MFGNLFPEKMSTITVVVLGKDNSGKIVALQRFSLAKSRHDIGKRFPSRNGAPVVGSRVYRELTKAECIQKRVDKADMLSALVSLCNTGERHYLYDVCAIVKS